MASLVVPRSHQLISPVAGLLLVATIVVASFTAVADSAGVSSSSVPPPPPPTTKPIEVYPGCSKTLMPKRCSFKLSNLLKISAEIKAIIGGPQLAADKLKTDSCITGCAKVLDEITSKVAAAKVDEEGLKKLMGYLFDTVTHNEGPIGPCECNCPEPCSAEEFAAVDKLGEVTEAMRSLGDQLEDLDDSDEKKAAAAEMEKSMDSGVLHVSCGLTKQPQKCSDELAALLKTMEDADSAAYDLQQRSDVKPAPALNSAIDKCTSEIRMLDDKIILTELEVKNLEEIRADIHSYVLAGHCKYLCPPPPPEKPCSANETAVADKLNVVHNAWVATDKFLSELLPPPEVKEAPKK